MNKATLVTTLGERCKVCYTCVRDCPAKAIRISNGRAEVVAERCIGCGNCVRVCSQGAKQCLDSTPEVKDILASASKKVAIVAPSFPAEFADIGWRRMVGMLRKAGFDLVCEVSFGADVVAARYAKLIKDNPDRRFIATTCPAVVAYVEKYHPSLLPNLAPVASPMIATARALRILHPDHAKIVFIGPCIAKKAEAQTSKAPSGQQDVDVAITFVELRRLFAELQVSPDNAGDSEFDPPHPGLGALFPLSGGMLQAAGIKVDLLKADVVTAEGKKRFAQAISEFEEGAFNTRLLEILCCNGCIMGPGMSSATPYFKRMSAVGDYVRARTKTPEWQGSGAKTLAKIKPSLDVSAEFKADDRRIPLPSKAEIDEVLKRMGKSNPEDELDCGACGYSSCREHASAILKNLAESEMCLPYTIERLRKSLAELNDSSKQLASTQQALINAEKLASMGQLSAGIAHEINNPLGVILLYANLLLDQQSKNTESFEDIKMIADQADRCKKIVSGLLNFARKNKVMLQPTNINHLVDHCMKSIIVPENVKIETFHKMSDPIAEVDPDQLAQVLTNLVVNAIEAMPESGGAVKVSSSDTPEQMILIVEDNGSGIAKENMNKIFEPLFTTKQMGKGTGLGLAVTYGIVKMHRGQIDVKSNPDPKAGPRGTTFTVSIPRKGQQI